MAVPAFGADGLLPLGEPFGEDVYGTMTYLGHSCTLEDIRDRLDQAFVSTTRPTWMREIEMLHSVAAARLSAFTMWVSGGFVVDTENPTSLYVVLDLPGDDFSALDLIMGGS